MDFLIKKLRKFGLNVSNDKKVNGFDFDLTLDMDVNDLQKNLSVNKNNALEIYNDLQKYKLNQSVDSVNTNFCDKFNDLSKADLRFKPGHEWKPNILAATYSLPSKHFKRIFKDSGKGAYYSEANSLRNVEGWTVLMYATVMGRENLVKFMLKNDVSNLFSQNEEGQTVLMLASSFGHSNIFKLLYSAVITSDNCLSDKIVLQKDLRGWTCLHYAVYYNQIECVKLLVKLGANPNEKDFTGITPTMLAEESVEQEHCLKVLLQSGGELKSYMFKKERINAVLRTSIKRLNIKKN